MTTDTIVVVTRGHRTRARGSLKPRSWLVVALAKPAPPPPPPPLFVLAKLVFHDGVRSSVVTPRLLVRARRVIQAAQPEAHRFLELAAARVILLQRWVRRKIRKRVKGGKLVQAE